MKCNVSVRKRKLFGILFKLNKTELLILKNKGGK